ncbi:MAG: DUF418 domain-containing protein [Pseudomonadota bacterium]
MNTLTSPEPTLGQNRLIHLDVLRGFALLGILLVNFSFFTAPIQSIVLADTSNQGIDGIAHWLVRWLAEGKFYALFSMLFGAGFALTFIKGEQSGQSYRGVYLRRLLALLLIGLVHYLLIWSGDILLIYSVVALLMWLLFARTPERRLLKWATVFFALPVLLMWLGGLSILLVQMAGGDQAASMIAEFDADMVDMREAVEQAALINASGSWIENVHQRLDDLAFMVESAIFWVPSILGFFLLGRWLLISGRLTKPAEHVGFFVRWRTWGLLIGLLLGALGLIVMGDGNWAYPTPRMATAITLTSISSVVLSLGYLSTVILSVDRLRFLAPAGQMALTNYLTQSLFWTWMFYGYGVGLYEQVPRSVQVLLALVFFALQVVFSQWWLKHFRFGPAEWVWRSLTYLKLQPMRRA